MPYIPQKLRDVASYASDYGKRREYQEPAVFKRFSDIPSEYETIPGGTEYNVDPSPLAKFRNLPEFIGGGQYVLDPEQRDELIKSARKYDPVEANIMRKGLPSHLFEIDHKIPLWAGGTDTKENKERLLSSQHAHKTKVGTVARTLYYNDKLSLTGARTMLLGWKDKDVEEIQLTDKGELSEDSTEALSKAIFLSQEWKKPKKIKVGWKDVWSEMKKNPLVRGVQSAISGFTAGLYKPDYAPVEEGKELETTIADMAGNIAGTIASFATIQGTLMRGARILGVKNLFGGAQSYKAAINAGEKVRTVGKIKVSPPIGMKIIQNVVPFTIHGQLAKTFEGEEFRYDGDRVHRFLSDVAFGSVVGVAGNTLKSYAGLGASVYGLGVLEGASPKEALMNSAIMVGFHGIGHKGRSKLIQDAATRESIKHLMKDTKIKIFPEKINPETKKPYGQEEMLNMYATGSLKFTEKEANKIAIDSFKSLNQNIKNNPEGYTPEIISKRGSEILTATRQLYKSSLGTEARLLEDIRDMKSLVKRESANKKTNTDMPEAQYNMLLKELPKIKNFEKGNVAKSEVKLLKKYKSDLPPGVTPVTGTVANKTDFTTATNEGMKRGSKVIILMRDDLYNFSLEVNRRAGHWTEMIGNPKYFGEVYYPSGNKFLRTGVLASENRKYNRKHSFISSTYKESEITSKLNKDTIGRGAEKIGAKYMVAEVNKVGFSKEKNPYMTIRIFPESYSVSKARVGEKQLPKMLKAGKPVYEHLFGEGSFYRGLGKEERAKLKSWSLLGKKKASDIVSEKDMSDGYKHLSSVMLKPLEKAFATKDIKRIRDAFKETVGINLSKEAAEKFAADKKLNVGKVIETIESARKRMKVEKDVEVIQGVKSKVAKADTKKVMKAVKVKEIEEMVKEPIQKPTEKAEIINKEILPVEKTKEGNVSKIEKENTIVEAELPSVKKESYKDFMNEEYGILKSVIAPFDNAILRFRNAGNSKLAETVTEIKNSFTRKNLTEIAKKAYKQAGEKNEKGFVLFKEKYESFFKKIKEPSGLDKKANSQALKHHFLRLLGTKEYPIVHFKNRKAIFSKEKGNYNHQRDAADFADKQAAIYKKANPNAKEIEVVSMDIGNSKFSGREKFENFNEIKKALAKENYVLIGSKKNDIKDLVAIKKNESFIKDFDADPSRWLSKNVDINKYAKGKMEESKMIKIYTQKVLGFSKEEPASNVIKRLPVVMSRELPNPIKGEKLGVHCFESKKFMDEYSVTDGAMFMLESMGKRISNAGGFIHNATQYKPTLTHRYGKGDGNLLAQKGNMFVIKNNDKVYKPFIEKLLQERFGKNREFREGDIITFYDNAKVGGKIFKDNGGSLQVPSEAFRFAYSNPHKAKGSFGPSVIGLFSGKDVILKKDIIKLYDPQVEKYGKLIKDINNNKDLKEVLSRYEIDANTSMQKDLLRRMDNEAPAIMLSKHLDDVVNKIFEREILHGNFLVKTDHLKLMPDIGILPGGKKMPSGEIAISKDADLSQVLKALGIRYPITDKTAISIDKVHIAEKLGVTSLGKDTVIISQYDVFKRKQADYDGDATHHFKVGKGKNEIPESLAKNIEMSKKELGEIKFEKPIPYDKTIDYNYKEMLNHTSKTLTGADVTEKTASMKRVVEAMVDANVHVKTSVNDKGFKVLKMYLGTSEKAYRTNVTKERAGKGFVPEEFKMNSDKASIEATTNLLQNALDSAKMKNLYNKMGTDVDMSYLWKIYLKTTDKKIANFVAMNTKQFQSPFTLDPSMSHHKIINNAALIEKINKSNSFSDLIESSGGTVGLVGELFRLFKKHNVEPLISAINNKNIQYWYDQLGRNAVIKKYSDRFEDSGVFSGKRNFIKDVSENKTINKEKVYKMVDDIKKLNKEYSSKYWKKEYDSFIEKYKFDKRLKEKGFKERVEELIRTKIAAEKKVILDKFKEKMENEKANLNQEERNALAFYLTTAYDAIQSLQASFYKKYVLDNKQYFAQRLESLYNELSSDIAKTYNRAAGTYADIKPKPQLFKTKIDETQILSSVGGTNKPLLNAAKSVTSYSKGKSPMTN